MYVCSIDSISLVVNVHKTDGCLTRGANPDMTPCSAGSVLGLSCLLRLVCPNENFVNN